MTKWTCGPARPFWTSPAVRGSHPGCGVARGAGRKLYALDIHPLAIEAVRRIASGEGLKQVETILSDGSGKTNLPGASVDVVLLTNAFHDFEDPERVLAELNRVLRRRGTLVQRPPPEATRRSVPASPKAGGSNSLTRANAPTPSARSRDPESAPELPKRRRAEG